MLYKNGTATTVYALNSTIDSPVSYLATKPVTGLNCFQHGCACEAYTTTQPSESMLKPVCTCCAHPWTIHGMIKPFDVT